MREYPARSTGRAPTRTTVFASPHMPLTNTFLSRLRRSCGRSASSGGSRRDYEHTTREWGWICERLSTCYLSGGRWRGRLRSGDVELHDVGRRAYAVNKRSFDCESPMLIRSRSTTNMRSITNKSERQRRERTHRFPVVGKRGPPLGMTMPRTNLPFQCLCAPSPLYSM